MDGENKNPWTAEDEREHFPSISEWWCSEFFFETVEDNKKWSLKAACSEWAGKNQIGSHFSMTLFDLDNNKYFSYQSHNYSAKLESAKDRFDVRYDDSFMRGSFPDYKMHLRDLKNNIELDVKYHSESLPHWIAQDVTNGWLPMGLGFYRYGFIPKCAVSGTMKINEKIFNVDGKGYFEHVWGSFSYSDPFLNDLGLKKTISTYTKLVGWWLHDHKIKIPKSITFSTENNPFGYDWIWALLENGWTIFYGNIMFWVMEGPAAGILVLSKDGTTYDEFYDIHCQYNKIRYSKNYDFFYPSELEITARKGKEKLHLCFAMTTESREDVQKLSRRKYYPAYVICEAPGVVEGYYFDGKKKIKLNGISKIEPQRQISMPGHNSLKLDFMLPPEGVGMSFDLDSHFFRKKVFTKIQLAPRPKIKFNMNMIPASKIHGNKV